MLGFWYWICVLLSPFLLHRGRFGSDSSLGKQTDILMDFIPVAATATIKDDSIYSVLHLGVCAFKSGFWSWMSYFRYAHKLTGHVRMAGSYTPEALSASSQSCDATVCSTGVSLRQFWYFILWVVHCFLSCKRPMSSVFLQYFFVALIFNFLEGVQI